MDTRGTNGEGDPGSSRAMDAEGLRRLQHQLAERIKEKTCLIEIMRVTAQPGLDATEMCQRVVGMIPAGWQYPGIAEARLAWGDNAVQTPGFRDSPWTQAAGFTASPGLSGTLTVAYLEERDAADEGPFLRDERDLIEALAAHIGASLANLAMSGALREREEILSSVVGLAADSIGLVDMTSGRFVEFNAAAHRNLGYTREEFARLGVVDIDARGMSPEALRVEFESIIAAGEAAFETRQRRRDGTIRDVRVTTRHIRVRGRDYLSAIWSDITERKLAERNLERANTALRTISACNRALARANLEQDLLREICDIVTGTGGYRMAWVGYAMDDPLRSVVPQARSGAYSDYLETMRFSWGDDAYGRGPTGMAIRERRPVAMQNILTDPRFEVWRAAALERGFASSIALPILLEDGECLGALMLYAAEPAAFDADEARLLAELSDNLAHGIRALRDRAARDRARDELHESASRMRHLLEASASLVYFRRIVDGKLMERDVSENITRMLGYSREEAVRKGWWSAHVHPDDLSGALGALDQLQQTGRVTREYRFAHKAGHHLWIHEELRLDHDADGRPAEVVGSCTDITQRKAAEQAIRKLSLAVEQSPEGVVITDLDARIEYVNPAFTHHTGYAQEEAVGRNPRFLGAGTTPRATYQDMWAALTAGLTWKGEFRNRRKDGRDQIEAATITPLRQADGRITHYVALKEDITEKKQMAAELERHREHLEALVEERTLALAEARERAEAASRAKSAFLANMSHEIRTPMNAILGLTHLILNAGVAPEQAERLRKVDAAGRHLLSLINDILDLSKVESGKLTLENVDFDLHASIQDACDACFRGIAGKNLVLRKEFDPTLPRMINGDPLRLNQVLLNLGGNAVKFTEHGTITLRVAQVGQTEGNPRVRFEIEDTGIGMSAEQCGRLFQPFEQADSSTTRKYGGTGLGLSISRRLVELMGGRIEVHSQPGLGSTFSFTIPLRAAMAPHGNDAPPAGQTAQPATAAAREIRILLVEDDPINQEVGCELLSDAGFRVDVADNGAVALERAAEVAYDLVLMDVQMPVLDGLAATRALRALPAYASTPIVAMTANAFSEDRQACFAAGMNDFISKPVDPPRLFAAIERWTGRIAPAAHADDDAPASPPDRATRDATLARLERMLAEDDYEAVEFVTANPGLLRSVLGNAAAAVESSIRGFRFEQALGSLRAARGDHG